MEGRPSEYGVRLGIPLRPINHLVDVCMSNNNV